MKSLYMWITGLTLCTVLIFSVLSANNAVGNTNGNLISSPQTWAGRVRVPSSTATSIVIPNGHVNSTSTILVTLDPPLKTSGMLTVTSVGEGTFTVSSNSDLGTGSGKIIALNYLIINPQTGDGGGASKTDWANQVSVSASAGTSLVVHDKHVNNASTIIVTPLNPTAASDEITVTSVNAGTFTVSSKVALGSEGMTRMLNYIIVNH